MSTVNKLLIIDNQYNQYKRLNESLTSEKYSVYPSDEEYKSFLSSVKVFIHSPKVLGETQVSDASLQDEEQQKEKAYRILAWDHILSFVDNSDMILMDYRLGSSLTCLTGLDLAQEIWAIRNIPILMLSRDEQTKEDTLLEWNKVINAYPNRIDWRVKGYWGTQLFPDSFVSTIIIPAIEGLYTKWKSSDKEQADERDKVLIVHLAGLLEREWHPKDNKTRLAELYQALNLGLIDTNNPNYRELRDELLKDPPPLQLSDKVKSKIGLILPKNSK